MLIFNILISPASPCFSNSYMLDTSPNRQKGMQIGKGGAKSDTPFDTLNRENAYLHETVWVETTASSRK